MAAGWTKTPVIARIFFIASHVSLIIFVLGYSTPFWVSADGMIPITLYDVDGSVRSIKLDHLGLWHACGSELPDSNCITILINKTPAWYGATRAFETMALIAALILSLGLFLWMFVEHFNKWNRAEFLLMVTTFVTAGLMLIGVIIWGAEVRHFLSWSFAFACISTILYTLIGLIRLGSMICR